MALNNLGHVRGTSVADLDGILIKKLVQSVANWEMLADQF